MTLLVSLVHQKCTASAMAKVIKRSCSTITRELKRNAQSLGYSSQAAAVCAKQRRIQGRAPNKLHDAGVLFGVVHYFVCIRWSPEQIALTLAHTLYDQVGVGVTAPAAQQSLRNSGNSRAGCSSTSKTE